VDRKIPGAGGVPCPFPSCFSSFFFAFALGRAEKKRKKVEEREAKAAGKEL